MFFRIVKTNWSEKDGSVKDVLIECNRVNVQEYNSLQHQPSEFPNCEWILWEDFKMEDIPQKIFSYAMVTFVADYDQAPILTTDCMMYLMNDRGKTVQSWKITNKRKGPSSDLSSDPAKYHTLHGTFSEGDRVLPIGTAKMFGMTAEDILAADYIIRLTYDYNTGKWGIASKDIGGDAKEEPVVMELVRIFQR